MTKDFFRTDREMPYRVNYCERLKNKKCHRAINFLMMMEMKCGQLVEICNDWRRYADILVTTDSLKQFYPERLFTFGCGDVFVSQDVGDVGTIAWDVSFFN